MPSFFFKNRTVISAPFVFIKAGRGGSEVTLNHDPPLWDGSINTTELIYDVKTSECVNAHTPDTTQQSTGNM